MALGYDKHAAHGVQLEICSIQFQKIPCTGSPTYRGGGWYILGEPDKYDGTNDDVLTPFTFVINDQCLMCLIEKEDQPPLKNIKKVKGTKQTMDDNDNPNPTYLN